jgi:hypothetical protein
MLINRQKKKDRAKSKEKESILLSSKLTKVKLGALI